MRLLPLLVLLVACGGDSSDSSAEKTPGGPCTDGSQCITGTEYCLILDSTSGAEGTCTTIPDACADDVCGCDEVGVECKNGSGCFAMGSAATVQCM